MVKSLPNLRPKAVLLVLIILLTIFISLANIDFIFRGQFLRLKDDIGEELRSALGKDVTIEGINFAPSGELKLKNIKISDQNNITYLKVKELDIRFSALLFFLNKTFFINELTFLEPVIFPPAKDLTLTFKKRLSADRYKLALSDRLLLKLKSGEVYFKAGPPGADSVKTGIDLWARLEGYNKIYSEGWIDLKKYSQGKYSFLKELFLANDLDKIGYKLKISLVKQTFFVDKLVLDFNQFKIEGKGAVDNYNTGNPVLNLKINLKEFNFVEKQQLKTKFFISAILNFILQIKGGLKEARWSIRLDKLRSKFPYLPSEVKIDNFYCNLKLSKDEFLIEDLACFLNNFPLGVKGKISNFNSPAIELSFISHPGQIESLYAQNPLNFMVNFSGRKDQEALKGDLSLKFDKLISLRPKKIHTLKLSAHDLSCKILNEPASALLFQAKDIVCEDNRLGENINFELNDFSSSAFIKENIIELADLTLSAYEGLVKGKGFVEFKRFPPLVFLDFEYEGFNLNKLAQLFHLDYELSGSLSGRGAVNNQAPFFLSGQANVSEGDVKKMKLLEMLSDFLNVPSFRDIYFDELSSQFSFSKEGLLLLKDVSLRGKDIYLNANLKFSPRQKIDGDMLVRLSTKMLRESFKLRMLFFLVGEKLPYVDFEFKIGGLTTGPHIQWLDGKFKNDLKRYLSPAGEEAIEKQIDEAIGPLIKNK